MTVGELIEKLKACPSAAPVEFADESCSGEIAEVEYVEGDKVVTLYLDNPARQPGGEGGRDG